MIWSASFSWQEDWKELANDNYFVLYIRIMFTNREKKRLVLQERKDWWNRSYNEENYGI